MPVAQLEDRFGCPDTLRPLIIQVKFIARNNSNEIATRKLYLNICYTKYVTSM